MKLLVLDQSTKVTGYSIWKNNRLTEKGFLAVNTSKETFERMKDMADMISKLIDKKKPEFVVFEQCQFQQNYKTYQQLSRLQGVIFEILFIRDLGFILVEPSAWKPFFGIKSRKRAEQKAEAIAIVKEKYGLDCTEDEADSIGIGYWAINNIKEKKYENKN